MNLDMLPLALINAAAAAIFFTGFPDPSHWLAEALRRQRVAAELERFARGASIDFRP